MSGRGGSEAMPGNGISFSKKKYARGIIDGIRRYQFMDHG